MLEVGVADRRRHQSVSRVPRDLGVVVGTKMARPDKRATTTPRSASSRGADPPPATTPRSASSRGPMPSPTSHTADRGGWEGQKGATRRRGRNAIHRFLQGTVCAQGGDAVADSTTRISQAAALHRQAQATVDTAAAILEAQPPAAADPPEQRHLAEELRAAATALVPGWLGAPLDAQSAATPLGGAGPPQFVRLGMAHPVDDARFPAVVPLLGAGHLTLDADARDPRVAGLLRCLLLRLLAAAPPGSLLVRAVDGTGGGTVFTPFSALADAGLMSPPATDRAGLREVLTEAEKWLRPARATGGRRGRRDRILLVVIATLPATTEGADLVRIAALAQQGPESGLYLIVAGWPPPPLTAETTQPPLPRTTMVSVRDTYAVVGDPPGATFGSQPDAVWLNAPVFLDDDPPAHLVDAVCTELAAHTAAASRVRLADLLPGPDEPLWSGDAADGLSTIVGHDGDNAVVLPFNDRAPHWMIGGRSGAGKTAF